jgi:mono/diheme cytochrome c family protein
MACGTCHARPGEESAAVPGDLAGGIRFRIRGRTAYAANITPDRRTGIGSWSDKEIVRALRQGLRPDGARLGGMPFSLYRNISDKDARAIVAYLRSLKPSENDVPRTAPPPKRPKFSFLSRSVPEVPRGNQIRYGGYLAGPLGRCIECHTPSNNGGQPDYVRMLGAGGVVFTGPWGQAISGNLTPDRDTGLGEFTSTQIKRMIVSGHRPNRTRVGRPMAHTYYQNMTEDDLDAIVVYLRSLKPIKNFVDK